MAMGMMTASSGTSSGAYELDGAVFLDGADGHQLAVVGVAAAARAEQRRAEGDVLYFSESYFTQVQISPLDVFTRFPYAGAMTAYRSNGDGYAVHRPDEEGQVEEAEEGYGREGAARDAGDERAGEEAHEAGGVEALAQLGNSPPCRGSLSSSPQSWCP